MIKIYKGKLDFIWSICNFFEKRIGFNKVVEAFCSNITYIFLDSKTKSLLKNGIEDLVVISIWMPAYLQNIQDVLRV